MEAKRDEEMVAGGQDEGRVAEDQQEEIFWYHRNYICWYQFNYICWYQICLVVSTDLDGVRPRRITRKPRHLTDDYVFN